MTPLVKLVFDVRVGDIFSQLMENLHVVYLFLVIVDDNKTFPETTVNESSPTSEMADVLVSLAFAQHILDGYFDFSRHCLGVNCLTNPVK